MAFVSDCCLKSQTNPLVLSYCLLETPRSQKVFAVETFSVGAVRSPGSTVDVLLER